MTRSSRFLAAAAATLAIATAGPAAAQYWSRTWAAAQQASMSASAKRPLPDLTDRTLRQVVRVSSGGDRLRLRLSNEMSDAALRIGAVHVAIAGADGRIVPGTDRLVTFAGAAQASIPGHAPLVSDVVALRVPALGRIAISIHFPTGAPTPTLHAYAAATAWIAAGDQTGAVALTAPERFGQRLVIAAVDVESPRPRRTVVALGDSITDGARATNDADRRWPDVLAYRLQKARMDVSVANAGIGGNRLLEDGTGPNALARLDRDVLSVPGVSHVIVLEGINDIGIATYRKHPTTPGAADLIAAYRQIIARAHARGVKVILATILPYKGAGYWSAQGDATRAAVNRWIRTTREADGVVDFDRAIADSADPDRMAAAYDGGDHLHPGDAGYRAMADSVDLTLLR